MKLEISKETPKTLDKKWPEELSYVEAYGYPSAPVRGDSDFSKKADVYLNSIENSVSESNKLMTELEASK
tara:strand:- start:1176 stop:1385 length:210 start_codon:yes stop_codon:yes gene_type:complete